MASAYQGAVEAVVAMVICALAGWWIDRRFGSGPWGLFVGMAVGFAALLLRLLRIKTPTIGRPDPLPGAPSHRDEDGHERDAGWTQVLTPNRDRDEESGGPPESK
jgi:F0F1-type ATP synthase assembly protein I